MPVEPYALVPVPGTKRSVFLVVSLEKVLPDEGIEYDELFTFGAVRDGDDLAEDPENKYELREVAAATLGPPSV